MKKKLVPFFLFFILEKAQKVNGEYSLYFENCINVNRGDYGGYFFANYSFFNNDEIIDGKITSFCCNRQRCSSSTPKNCSLPIVYPGDGNPPTIYCNKINGSLFCNDGKFCGGIMDGKSINADIKIGDCGFEIETVKNYLLSEIGKLKFVWDFIPPNYSINGYVENYVHSFDSDNYYYVYWICENDRRCSDLAKNLVCNWDGSGWTCWNSSSFDHNEIYNDVRKSCYLQWRSVSPILMKFKFDGLPIPWPIALVSASISLIGVFTASSEIGWLSILSIILTGFRCSLVLSDSWTSWKNYNGLEKFQYSELAWTTSLIVWIYLPTINNLSKKMMRSVMWPINLFNALLDRMPEFWSGCLAFFSFPLLLVYFLASIIWIVAVIAFALFNAISPPLSYLWNIISLGIYASLQNFPGTSQFFVYCEKKPTTVSWRTIIQCFPNRDGKTFACFLGSKDVLIVNMLIRALGVALPFFCVYGHDGKFYKPPIYGLNLREGWGNRNEDIIEMDNIGSSDQQENNFHNEDSRRKSFIKYLAKWSSIIIFGVTFFYVITMALIQIKGLDTTGLESCHISQNLLTSKTGYLKEWWNQKAPSLKQIALF